MGDMSILSKRQFAGVLSPEALHRHAADWVRREYPETATCAGASGMCEDVSHGYARALGHGAVPMAHDYVDEQGEWDNGHAYVRVPTTRGDYAVDHTARQGNNPDAPWPVVRPFAEHEAWVRAKNDKPGRTHEVYENGAPSW